MSEQMNLFSTPSWAEGVWRTLDAEKRREILSILAEMARRAALAAKPLSPAEEAKHES